MAQEEVEEELADDLKRAGMEIWSQKQVKETVGAERQSWIAALTTFPPS